MLIEIFNPSSEKREYRTVKGDNYKKIFYSLSDHIPQCRARLAATIWNLIDSKGRGYREENGKYQISCSCGV